MARFPRASCRAGTVSLGILVAMLVAWPAWATDIVRIEEDWELVVSNPDPTIFAPQVTATISPVGDLSGYYSVFDLNLRNQPVYEAGGMQLQVWNGSSPVATRKSGVGTLLHDYDETVSWTQVMSVQDGLLHFSIVDGSSSTWGGFGSNGALSVDVENELTNLNQYSVDVSVANSGIGFAANRVESLILKAVRAYSETELVAEDTNPRVVYQRE